MEHLKENNQNVRTISGFQEFTKNGKESICEDSSIKNVKIYLRKKKE